ncbi:MAG TPA: saccharopine dehydrogenase C-terminal domain-containing protein, partial [Atribacterota bacterium]|nr:saccharopine dehydrogenase C-terminal domain-containing protein [Atribacterota bacterium]
KPQQGETDICVMLNTVTGIKNGKNTKISYYMWEGADIENNISAMGRVTSFTESIAAMMLGNGEIKQKGIVAPEDAFAGENYKKMINELKKRGIEILEVEETLP